MVKHLESKRRHRVARGLTSLTGAIEIHGLQSKEAKIQWIAFFKVLRKIIILTQNTVDTQGNHPLKL